MSTEQNADSVPVCRNCGEPIRWSLDSRRWLHDGRTGRVRYCVANFDADNNPTTEAEPQERSADSVPCPACGELHDWSRGEPVLGMPVIVCDRCPPDKMYRLPAEQNDGSRP